MSEVMSFGNIVNSLLSVRNEYNEHLKSVPQYEAFLLVESSTSKVADTLRGITSSGAPSMAAEVIDALETAKAKFREHLATVPEYRALLAIDKLISDVSADLGVQAEAQTVSQAAAEQASVDTNAAAQSDVIAPSPVDDASVAHVGAAELIQDAPAEVAVVETTPVTADAVAQAATADLTSAQAISQIHTALQSPEQVDQASPVAVSEIAQQAALAVTEQQAFVAPVADTLEQNAEKAA
jgi:hypothetical protein